jgi:hypothetical protein
VITPPKTGSRGDRNDTVRAPSAAARSSNHPARWAGRASSDTSAVGTYAATRSSMCARIPDGSTDGV